ncbi:HlyD family efflux transporter periplasmic adaptor subunit [Clostridium sp. D46t1_190503_E9]|uniref:HlyD family efflux transporter periplasmic adaptor subunit n=1 Tax=Clostridium sp. D46t1_190503_E9 TaxID=2787137 RepID=UPI00325FC082
MLKKQGYDDKQIEDYAKTQKNKSDEHYYKTISEFTNEKNQYELELSKLVAQKEALEKGKGQYEVVAQKGGIVHLNTPLTSGMVLQGGSLIGTITSKEEELIIETMLPSSDRPRIHIEDEVALAIGGLLQSEYGAIPGKVISIDEDATMDNEKGNVFFLVKVKPDKTYLEDSKGEKVNLTIGMVTETRVKYEKISEILNL